MDAATIKTETAFTISLLKKRLENQLGFFHKFINRESAKGMSLIVLMIYDIFRGIRKYSFCTKKIILKELGHLLNRNQFPAHYPSCLNSAEAGCNLAFLSLSNIKSIHYTLRGIFNIEKDNEALIYAIPSDEMFQQLCTSRNDVMNLFMLLMDFLLVSDSKSQSSYYSELPVTHPQKLLDKSLHYFNRSKRLKRGMIGYINYTNFIHIVPRRGTRKQLLISGELYSDMYAAVYISSYTYEPWIHDSLKPILYSNFYKYAIVNTSSIKNYTIYSTPKIDFCFHIKPGKKEYFQVRNSLDPDYVVTSSMYRLNRSLQCPIEFIDKTSDEFTADNYVRKMTSPLDTQHFLENFDGAAMVNILESIPNFVYAFSEQQRKLISSHHNTVVVGRSGTGKTTCAVMRMIGIRLLEIASYNSKRGIKKIRYQDLCNSSQSLNHRILPQDDIHHGISTARSERQQALPQGPELPEDDP